MTAPTATLRRLDVPEIPRSAPTWASIHAGHTVTTIPVLRICFDCERAERCVCGGWIVDDFEPIDGGFAAIRAHQRTAEHRAYHKSRHDRDCRFCSGERG